MRYEPMPTVLTINGGSSSIRFAVFEAGRPPRPLLQGKLDRIGGAEASLSVEAGPGQAPAVEAAIIGGVRDIDSLLDWLKLQPLFKTIAGVAHRVVHGMLHTAPQLVTSQLLE